MGKNYDPVGAVPPEDSNGRLRLDETNANYVNLAFGTFVLSCIVLFSLFYRSRYFSGELPHFTQGREEVLLDTLIRFLGVAGFFMLPVLPFLFWALIFPPSLVVDDQGIVARKIGRMRRMRWEEIHTINLIRVPADRYGGTKTVTFVEGRALKLSWFPVYGVDPQALAAYLNARRAKARSD